MEILIVLLLVVIFLSANGRERNKFEVGDVLTSKIESESPYGPDRCWLVMDKRIGKNGIAYYKVSNCSADGIVEDKKVFFKNDHDMKNVVRIAKNRTV